MFGWFVNGIFTEMTNPSNHTTCKVTIGQHSSFALFSYLKHWDKVMQKLLVTSYFKCKINVKVWVHRIFLSYYFKEDKI